jgi:hypothetical protein
VRIDELAEPEGDDELFDADPEALLLRPYMTGDVFVDVDTGIETASVMIGGHPCAIRGAGGKLGTRVPCFVLRPVATPIAYSDWPEHHFDKFPLSDALGLGENQTARLTEWRSVHKRELTRDRRRVTLTDRGVYILQQRFTHSSARAAIPLIEFERASRPVLSEAELEYEWLGELVDPGADQGSIEALVREFHAFLDQAGARELLYQEGGESRARALVRQELRERANV